MVGPGGSLEVQKLKGQKYQHVEYSQRIHVMIRALKGLLQYDFGGYVCTRVVLRFFGILVLDIGSCIHITFEYNSQYREPVDST